MSGCGLCGAALPPDAVQQLDVAALAKRPDVRAAVLDAAITSLTNGRCMDVLEAGDRSKKWDVIAFRAALRHAFGITP